MKRARSRSPLATARDRRDLAARGRDRSDFTLARTQRRVRDQRRAGRRSRSARRTRSTTTTRWRSWCSTSCVTRSPRARRRCDSPTGGSTTSPSTSCASTPACACRRALADRFGLRAVMAPTTPYREYYAALPADPLRGAAGDRATRSRARPRRARASKRRRGARRSSRRCGDGGRDRTRGGRRARGASARLRARAGGRDLRHVRLAVRRRARRRGHALPAERARQRRRRAHGAQPPGLRALGAARRLPAPAARAAARPIIRSPCRCAIRWSGRSRDLIVRHGHRFEIRREGSRCAALAVDSARRDAALRLHDLREPAAAVPRVRGRRAALPGRAPARRPLARTRARRAPSRAMAETVDLVRAARRARRAAGAAAGARARLGARAGGRAARAAAIARRAQGPPARPAAARAGRAAGRGAGAAGRAPRRRARWPAGRAGAEGRRRRLGTGGLVGGAAARRGGRAGRPSSSRASRCSRAAAIWRCITRGAAHRELELLLRRGRARGRTPTASSTRAPRIARASPTVIADLVRFGAPDEIAVEARPHVGSNRLPRVLQALREHLVGLGVDVSLRDDASPGCASRAGASARVRLAGGDELPADVVVLAVGHSARAVYAWAAADGIALERKPIAIGVRIEHPQRADRRDPVRRRRRAPKLPPGVLRADQRGRRSRRLQLLHVPGRLDRPRGDRGRRRRRQRHEPVAPRLAVRERRPGRHRRRGRLRTGGGGPAGRRRAAAAGRAGGVSRGRRPVPRAGAAARRTFSTAAPARRSARPATGPGSRRPTSAQVLPDFVAAGAARGPAPHGRAAARLPVSRRGAGRRRDADQRAGAPAARRERRCVAVARGPLSVRRGRGIRGRHRQRRARRRARRGARAGAG